MEAPAPGQPPAAKPQRPAKDCSEPHKPASCPRLSQPAAAGTVKGEGRPDMLKDPQGPSTGRHCHTRWPQRPGSSGAARIVQRLGRTDTRAHRSSTTSSNLQPASGHGAQVRTALRAPCPRSRPRPVPAGWGGRRHSRRYHRDRQVNDQVRQPGASPPPSLPSPPPPEFQFCFNEVITLLLCGQADPKPVRA